MNSIIKIFFSVSIIIGQLLIVAESAILLTVLNSGFKHKDWICVKNNTLALSDILLGIIILVLFLIKPDIYKSSLLYILLCIIFVTHIFRSIEFISNSLNPFFFNVPLFTFSIIRTLFIFASLISGILMVKG